ncbi:MAG: hypothetical protein EOP68_01655 [Sphingomonas sp.]|nr:MAG: hypothetical protein EOP68_01655 [Sphingomonas sp.]
MSSPSSATRAAIAWPAPTRTKYSPAPVADIVSLGGTGGLIVVAPSGETAWRFSTPGMYRATVTADGARRIAIYGDEA